MKKKLLIVCFLFFLEENLKSYDHIWDKIKAYNENNSFYIDINNIIQMDGYTQFWELIDYSVKDEYGDLSAKILIQGDCKYFRFKWLKVSYHKFPMAKDTTQTKDPSEAYKHWHYPPTKSTSAKILEYVCAIAGVSI